MHNFVSKIIPSFLKNRDAKSASDYFNLGITALENKDYTNAVKHFTKSVNIDNTKHTYFQFRALSYLRSNKFKNAVKDYSTAISVSPGVKELFLERGLAYHNLLKYKEAIKDYSSSIELDSEYERAVMSRGLSYFLLPDYAKALADLEKSVKLNPANDKILKEYIDECRKLVKPNPKSSLNAFLNNPLVKEQQANYDLQCKMIDKMKSTDQDEIPWGIGVFGYDASNPIPAKTSFGSISYLSKLQTLQGEKVEYKRVGSEIVSNIENPVDIYEISDSTGFICNLYVSMYHRKNSEKAPNKFKINKLNQ